MLLPTTTISMRFSLHLKRLQDWPIPANVTIEPNESWLAQGQEPTIAEWAEEKAKIDAAPTNSAERFCRELNRKLRRLNLWISDDCWDWKAPVVLYQRDVQLVTLSFESNFLLGHLKAVGEWQQWVADAIATPPAELLEYRQGITDWEQQWTSRGAFVSWWWQKQQRAKAEGKEQWGGVECPVMSICRLCREEVRRVEICEHCDTAWFLCEKCG